MRKFAIDRAPAQPVRHSREGSLRASTGIVALALLAAGCAAGPDYRRPDVAPPAAATFQTASPGTTAAPAADAWWRLYNDPVLDRLIERALAANTDLRAARANLLRAQYIVRESRAGRLPTGDFSASANYTDQAAPGQGGGGGGGDAQWTANAGQTLSWEADLFGRIGRSIEAARADAEAEAGVRDRVAVTVAAETARAYVDACALAESAAVARESIAIAERQLTLQRQRERVGAASLLDSERSATTLANARAALPGIDGRRRAALFELAALLGAAPAELPEEAHGCVKAPAPIQPIPVGDGQALLARRPDVREAERRLAAQTARIGVATAELYPRISLGGSGSFLRSDAVRGGDSFSFSLGPLISWSLPNLTVGRARVQQAEAGAAAALAAFDGAVLTALKEVEQALALYAAESERQARLAEAETHAAKAFDLADRRYRAGSIGFLEQLDAQRQWLDARAARASSNQQLGSLRVDLFKALGGGWKAS